MRLSKWAVILAFAASVFAAPENTYNLPRVLVFYKNEIREVYESPFFLSVQDRLQILETKARHYKIKSATGQVGWVEKGS